MNCECGAWSTILETRGTRRRRQCANNHRFTTTEVLAVDNDERNRAICEPAVMPQAQADDLAARFGISASQVYRIRRKSLRDVKSDL